MAKRRSSGSGLAKYIVIMFFAAMLVLGIFLALNRTRFKKQSEEDNLVLTKVQTITTMNLDMAYPANEREVVALWSRIEQTLYNEQYTDREQEEMCAQLMSLYDNDLLLNQPNYAAQLRREVEQKKEDGFTIQNYVVASKDDVIFFSDAEGFECAGLECMFTIMNGPIRQTLIYDFILRKDETGRWKIFGWMPKDDQTVHLINS